MKKLLIIVIVVIAGLLLLVWLGLRIFHGSKPAVTQNQSEVQFPTGSLVSSTSQNAGSGISLATASGTVIARNFLADPETKEDPSNKGYYYLGNQPTDPVPYVIEYLANTHYINVSLLEEPIGLARAQAEAYLLGHLGLSKQQLCSLDYMVSTPDSVNSTYSDENLGFSFCPGAVKLPY